MVSASVERLDRGKAGRVERSLEQTNAGLTFKAPKTKAGRRASHPTSIRSRASDTHWRRKQEQRLARGIGKAADDGLVLQGTTGAMAAMTR